MTANPSDYVVIEGLLLPAARDHDGKVLRLSIATFDEQTYLVQPGQAADAMIGLLEKEVRVWGGLLTREGRGMGIISVENFERLPDNEPDFWACK